MRLENEKKSQEKDSQEANFDEEEKEKTEKKKEEKTEEKGLMEEGKTSSILREAEYTNVEGRRYRWIIVPLLASNRCLAVPADMIPTHPFDCGRQVSKSSRSFS